MATMKKVCDSIYQFIIGGVFDVTIFCYPEDPGQSSVSSLSSQQYNDLCYISILSGSFSSRGTIISGLLAYMVLSYLVTVVTVHSSITGVNTTL